MKKFYNAIRYKIKQKYNRMEYNSMNKKYQKSIITANKIRKKLIRNKFYNIIDILLILPIYKYLIYIKICILFIPLIIIIIMNKILCGLMFFGINLFICTIIFKLFESNKQIDKKIIKMNNYNNEKYADFKLENKKLYEKLIIYKKRRLAFAILIILIITLLSTVIGIKFNINNLFNVLQN